MVSSFSGSLPVSTPVRTYCHRLIRHNDELLGFFTSPSPDCSRTVPIPKRILKVSRLRLRLIRLVSPAKRQTVVSPFLRSRSVRFTSLTSYSMTGLPLTPRNDSKG
ncbi:MAG: hypothetical protein V7K60_09980 [Nostoc sp.]